jgi:predicted kinase
MHKQIGLGVLFVSLLGSTSAMAQYPTIPPELEAKEEAAAKEAKQKSEEAWKKAYLIVEQDHKKGKIYVPNASKPSDCSKLLFLHFQVLKAVAPTLWVGVEVKYMW